MKKWYLNAKILALVAYVVFVATSFYADYLPGVQIGQNFFSFAAEMLTILPCAFILIGLFEVWVKAEHVEKHLGTEAGYMCYVWAILLSGTSVGGLYVTFPVAAALFEKKARLSVIFTYIGASAVCRIPMIIFEASFLGLKFSLVRIVVALPLVVLSSIWLGNLLEKQGYRISTDG